MRSNLIRHGPQPLMLQISGLWQGVPIAKAVI
jgi:hypothetical protein